MIVHRRLVGVRVGQPSLCSQALPQPLGCPSHAGAGHAAHKVSVKTAKFGGCQPHLMWEVCHAAPGLRITARCPSVVRSMSRPGDFPQGYASGALQLAVGHSGLRRLVVGGWRWVAVGSWRLVAVGSGRRLAGGLALRSVGRSIIGGEREGSRSRTRPPPSGPR